MNPLKKFMPYDFDRNISNREHLLRPHLLFQRKKAKPVKNSVDRILDLEEEPRFQKGVHSSRRFKIEKFQIEGSLS